MVKPSTLAIAATACLVLRAHCLAESPPAIYSSFKLPPGEVKQIDFEMVAVPPGRVAVLTLKARLETPRPAGYTPSMRVVVNGQALDVTRLVRKKPTELRTNGSTQNMAAGERFTVGYAPDFTSPDAHPSYALRNVEVCAFEFKITDLLRAGSNRLHFENAIAAGLTNALVVSEGRIELRLPTEIPQKSPPPTGPLPVCVPAESHVVNYKIDVLPNNDLTLRFEGQEFQVSSRFSTPAGKWEKGTNPFFAVDRQIERRDEAIVVRDTLTNQTDENLPIMQRHRVPMELDRVWLAGLSPDSRTGRMTEPANPTSFGVAGEIGIGLMPLDDVGLVHAVNSADTTSIGLADENLVLRPGAVHTTEWAIFPVPSPDYFALVNAARRLRNVNFTIDGGFAFLRSHPEIVGKWSDLQLANFIRRKDARYVCISIDYPQYQGHYPHGTAFQTLDLGVWKREVDRRRALVPDAQNIAYFHCFIDVLDIAATKYADARVLRADGSQADYGRSHDKLFFPTKKNGFGKDVAQNVDRILGELGFDGVYWDELAYSRYRYHYGEPWDSVSADIDPATMQITRLKSSVALITQSWRVDLVKRIVAQGPLIGNGAPHTRTMAALHFPRFIETGAISNLHRGQLYTPIALGDHLTERNEEDAYRVMRSALDYGCVYHWYNDVTVVPTHHHLTRYMFPMTPLELHAGYIHGTERIVTNRSGLYGWNDHSAHEVHVFDNDGRELPGFQAPLVERDGGRTLTELRIAEGQSAAIIRRVR